MIDPTGHRLIIADDEHGRPVVAPVTKLTTPPETLQPTSTPKLDNGNNGGGNPVNGAVDLGGSNLGIGDPNFPDYSDELNGVIMKCCNEFWPTLMYYIPSTGEAVKAINTGIWINGVFGNWNYVADKAWRENKDTYIPESLCGLDKHDDYFKINGHTMNRESFGNYVKGATAQYAFPSLSTSTTVNVLSTVWSIYKEIFWENSGFNLTNEAEDWYGVYTGAKDMASGVIK